MACVEIQVSCTPVGVELSATPVEISAQAQPVGISATLVCELLNGAYLYVKPEGIFWVYPDFERDVNVYSNTNWNNT